jgi:TonB family protein
MEAFGNYLLKSAVWLTGFTLVFLVFLRNERYFRLNRVFLLLGIFASVVFPFYTWHYAVMLPSLPAAEISIPDLSETSMVTAVIPDNPGMPFYWRLYIVGIAFLAFRMIWQTAKVIGKLRRNGYVKNGPVKLVRTPEYSASFSFFSFVFVNPSTSDTEMKEILNHESGHIQKQHWFDLLMVELLRIMQWFNPFAWVYAHLVRQNHEYLADEMALQRTSNPAIYRAALLNQMLGVPVISLANSFSYSLNKQRFKMMKKKIESPFRKLKLLVVLPLMALIFYAFAKPEYRYEPNENLSPVSNNNDLYYIEKDSVNVSFSNQLDNKDLLNIKSRLADVGIDVNYTSLQFTEEGKLKKISATYKYPDGTKGNFFSPDLSIAKSFWGFRTKLPAPAPGVVRFLTDLEIENVDNHNLLASSENGTVYETSKTTPAKETAQKEKGKVKGKVTAEDGKPLQGASVVTRGTTIGTVTDAKGNFALKDVPADAELVISYVGLKTAQVKPDFKQTLNITLDISTVAIGTVRVGSGAPPTFKIRGIDSENPPMIMLDGRVIDNSEMKKINPNDIDNISVFKDKSATEKYGEQGKNGVILITTKGNASATPAPPKNPNILNDVAVVGYGKMEAQKEKKPPHTIVEQMPQYPGGEKVMMYFLSVNTKYPPEAKAAKIEGTVVVNFLVSRAGKIENVKVVKSVHPALDAEAVRVVSTMPDWSPGKQNGKPVDVYYSIPIEFSLKSAGEKSLGNSTIKNGDQEVVVVGYGTNKSGAQKINADSLLISLQHKGESEQPIVYLDNRMINISEIKPEDIAQISVLKSESATRAYGEKGKNGVIIITSKQEEQRHIIDGEKAFVVVEQMPQFPGGENAMREFIQKTLKYPEDAKKNKVQATVIVNFVIDKEGRIRNPRIMRGSPELNDEAMRILNSMPAWAPGKQGGKAVPVSYTIPIKFVLPATEAASQQITDKPVLYGNVNEKPHFPGGDQEMLKFINANIKYPISAQEEGASGTALVYFIVRSNGKIENVRLLNNIHSTLQDEALRVIRNMPDWVPGKKGNEAVDVACTIPLKFIPESKYQESIGKFLAIGGALYEIPFDNYPAGGNQKRYSYLLNR